MLFDRSRYIDETNHIYCKADCESRALSLYSLSAVQGSGEAFSKLGDMFYYGLGWLTSDKRTALDKQALLCKSTSPQ